MRTGWAACWVGACALGCGSPPPAPSAEGPAPSTSNEPVVVQRGARAVRVVCELDCSPLRNELERLSEGCRRDPRSTPHAVTADPTRIGLGCCEEAASAYPEACGDEHLGPCISEWLALCQRAFTVPASAISGAGGS